MIFIYCDESCNRPLTASDWWAIGGAIIGTIVVFALMVLAMDRFL